MGSSVDTPLAQRALHDEQIMAYIRTKQPLDGGRILVGLLPNPLAYQVSRIEPWGFFVVMALVITGVVSNLWLRPLMVLTSHTIEWVLTPLRALLF